LSHAFDQQHRRYDRTFWKRTLEIGFIDRDVQLARE
jgi:hypothetical protein